MAAGRERKRDLFQPGALAWISLMSNQHPGCLLPLRLSHVFPSGHTFPLVLVFALIFLASSGHVVCGKDRRRAIERIEPGQRRVAENGYRAYTREKYPVPKSTIRSAMR